MCPSPVPILGQLHLVHAPISHLLKAHLYPVMLDVVIFGICAWNSYMFPRKFQGTRIWREKIFIIFHCWVMWCSISGTLGKTRATLYTGCPGKNGQTFGRVFLRLNYTDITQNTYIQSWTVTEIMAWEVWNFDSCYTLIDYQIHIKTGRNMWFL